MKKIPIIICSLILACVIAAATFFTLATPAEKDTIGSQKALEIALQDAGIKVSDAKGSKSILTKKNQAPVFDVEFEFGNNDYDYIINAKSGEIISRDIETDNNDEKDEQTTTVPAETTAKAAAQSTSVSEKQAAPENVTSTTAEATTATETRPSTTTEKATSAFITAAKAKEIALKNADVKNSEAVFEKVKLEKDDGVFQYEIEFFAGTTKYEYSVNAKTGAIIDKDIDKNESVEKPAVQTTTPSEEPTSAFISIDKAKNIALSHAGLSESSVRFEKVKLDKDDGIYEYEVEFYLGNKEYEYSINAKTGAIIDFEIEEDD